MPLIERSKCDICENNNLLELFSHSYEEPFLKNLLIKRHDGNLYESDIKGYNYTVFKCLDCNFIFQKYIPDEELNDRLCSFSKERAEIGKNKKSKAKLSYYAKHSLLSQKASLLLNKKPSEINILDFGSGWGHFLIMAKAYGFKTYGVEISKERKIFSEEMGLNIHKNLNDLEIKFDFIHSDQTFEHLKDPKFYLKKLVEKLNPDGIIYISTPNCSETHKKSNRENIDDNIFPLEHINGFTNKSLRRMALEVGLEPLKSFEIFIKLSKETGLFYNGSLLQEAIKAPYLQNFKTDIYFKKK